jgi:hypothetical protein
MRKGFMGLTLIISMLASQTAALAWGDMGHMLVGYIAYSKLKPKAQKRVDELVKLITLTKKNKQGKTITMTYVPATIACWMDDMRDVTTAFDTWHYTNLPFFDGIPVKPGIGPKPVNAVTQIEWAIGVLKSNTTELKKAKALGYLFHLVGDIHQPLHSTSRYTTAHPNGDGDRGGNLFFITGKKNNLHSYWDAAAGLFAFKDIGRPLTSAGWKQLGNYAFEIVSAYPENKVTNLNEMSPGEWASEGHELVEANAYIGVEQNSNPDSDPEYPKKVKDIARLRIALGGYRLGNLLNKIFAG